MPAYGTPGAATVHPGEFITLINAETPATGYRSIYFNPAVMWDRRDTGVSIEFIFSGNPGVLNFQIQGANTEADAAYLTEGSGTLTAANGPQSDGTYRARVELSPWVAQHCRILVSAATANPVTATVIASVI
jgi:hypothetical protein